MGSDRRNLRHVMLHYFRKGDSVKSTVEKICTEYGDGAITVTTVRHWFKKFKGGNFNLADEDRSGRPKKTDTDLIKAMLDENPRYSVREIVNATRIPKTTVHNHLTKMGYANQQVKKTKRKRLPESQQMASEETKKRNNIVLKRVKWKKAKNSKEEN